MLKKTDTIIIEEETPAKGFQCFLISISRLNLGKN